METLPKYRIYSKKLDLDRNEDRFVKRSKSNFFLIKKGLNMKLLRI
jgi:hypothetical protein